MISKILIKSGIRQAGKLFGNALLADQLSHFKMVKRVGVSKPGRILEISEQAESQQKYDKIADYWMVALKLFEMMAQMTGNQPDTAA